MAEAVAAPVLMHSMLQALLAQSAFPGPRASLRPAQISVVAASKFYVSLQMHTEVRILDQDPES